MRYLKALLCIVFTFVITAVGMPTAFAEKTVAIGTFEELCAIADNLSGSYYLTDDINADGKKLTAIGSAEKMFTGTLDGRGHTVYDAVIDPSESENGSSAFGGLFAYNKGTVKNLNLAAATVKLQNNRYSYAGGIAAVNLGKIENCYVSGVIKNTYTEIASYTGGIVGEQLDGSVKNCVSYADIYTSGGEQYTGGALGCVEQGKLESVAVYGSVFTNGVDTLMDAYCGGIVGVARGGSFKNTLFAGGAISEKHCNIYLGGFSGLAECKIEGFVCSGSIMPSEIFSHMYIGGVAGQDSDATVNGAYYRQNTVNEKLTGKGGKSLTDAQFKTADSFAELDFKSAWQMADGVISLRELPSAPEKEVSELLGVEIQSKPKKLKYTQGDQSLDLTGLKVAAVYSDKKVALKQNEYTVGGYNYALTGKQTVTVSYRGFTASFEITVAEYDGVVLPSIVISDHSYQEGNSNSKPAKEATASSQSTSAESTASQSSNAIVSGNNAVIDNLDDDSTPTGGSAVSGNDSSASTHKKGSHAWALVTVAVIAALLVAAAVAFAIIRLQGSGGDEEAVGASIIEDGKE